MSALFLHLIFLASGGWALCSRGVFIRLGGEVVFWRGQSLRLKMVG